MKLDTIIVEDDRVISYMHEMVVIESRLSQEPKIAFNGREALDLIAKDSNIETKFLLLLDINMPVMNGWQLLDSIQKSSFSDRVLVVIVTSSVDKADKEKSYRYKQVIKYIEKPMTVEVCKGLKSLPMLSDLLDET